VKHAHAILLYDMYCVICLVDPSEMRATAEQTEVGHYFGCNL
jgi:hypothetical protein